MTKADALYVIALLRTAYPHRPLPQETVALYAQFLGDIEVAEGMTAVKEWVGSHNFFPAISELREAVFRRRRPSLDWGKAWREAVNACVRYGRDRTPVFSDPALEETVDVIGWTTLCSSSENDGTLRAQFRDVYQSIRARLDHEARSAPVLEGYHVPLLGKGSA